MAKQGWGCEYGDVALALCYGVFQGTRFQLAARAIRARKIFIYLESARHKGKTGSASVLLARGSPHQTLETK